MSNFEAKHPRAKDGKFTEKRRKEAGFTLENSLGEPCPVSEKDSTPKVKVGSDWIYITELEGYIFSHEDEHLEITDFAWPGESSSEFPKDMDYARNFSETYCNLEDDSRPAYNAYCKNDVVYGIVPEIADFDNSFQGEYASFDDFAAGYANDLVIESEDYEEIREFFDYDAYKRDTGLGKEEAEELITSGDTETIKRYFNYKAFAKDREDLYAIDDAPGGNVFVFIRN